MKTALSAVLAGLLAGAPALAQTPSQPVPAPPAATPPAATPPAASPAATPPPNQVDLAVEHRIAMLRSRFKITPSEERPFSDFAQIMRENAHRMAELVAKRNAAAREGNAVDQLRSYAELQRVHSEDLQRMVPAFSNLYEALTPDQRKRADQSFRELAGIRT